jgi:hypothetical protein
MATNDFRSSMVLTNRVSTFAGTPLLSLIHDGEACDPESYTWCLFEGLSKRFVPSCQNRTSGLGCLRCTCSRHQWDR